MTAAAALDKPVIIVVDDDPLLRASLDTLFRSVDFTVLAFPSAQELLETELPQTPICLVIDVRMPQMGGFECRRKLVERGIDIPSIFLTGHGDIPMSVKAMKAGAVDFLTKPFREEDMLDAVYACLGKAERKQVELDQIRVTRERFSSLSPRERQVMQGVVRGLLNKQIAGDLGVSEITVKLHRSSMMKKMALRTVPDLVRAADALGTHLPSDRAETAA